MFTVLHALLKSSELGIPMTVSDLSASTGLDGNRVMETLIRNINIYRYPDMPSYFRIDKETGFIRLDKSLLLDTYFDRFPNHAIYTENTVAGDVFPETHQHYQRDYKDLRRVYYRPSSEEKYVHVEHAMSLRNGYHFKSIEESIGRFPYWKEQEYK